jgi:hypothetical protein
MSLNFDLRKVSHYKRLYRKNSNGTFKLNQISETIILSTMSVGMRSITEKNWEKFYNRLHLLETIHGSFFYSRNRGKMVPRYITKDEVKRLIGLKVNVMDLTPGQFLKRFEKNQF